MCGSFKGDAKAVKLGAGDVFCDLGSVSSEVVQLPVRVGVYSFYKLAKIFEGGYSAVACIQRLFRTAKRGKQLLDGFGSGRGARRHSGVPGRKACPENEGKKMVSRPGLEPGTRALKVRCSTN